MWLGTIVLMVFIALQCINIDGAEWTYEGSHGPAYWPTLGYEKCEGSLQSPINIKTDAAKRAELEPVNTESFNHDPNSLELTNNGHAVQVNVDGDYVINNGGLEGDYKVLQYHFHFGTDGKGSEHTINGDAYPMEMHIVTYNTRFADAGAALHDPKGLGVLGFFFQVGEENEAFKTLVETLPDVKNPGNKTDMSPFPLGNLLKGVDLTDFYRYAGSLTTPPCSEAVVWTVYANPITISKNQLEAFVKVEGKHGILANNFRPIQDLNGREILHTKGHLEIKDHQNRTWMCKQKEL